MTRRTKRMPCLDCGVLTNGTRCPKHAAMHVTPTRASYDSAERRRRLEAVHAHRMLRGDWCPGWRERASHLVEPPNDLTADHVVALAAGGDPKGELIVRCRVCNGAKGARADS